MKVYFEADNNIVYEITTYDDGTVRKIRVRICNTEAEAKAVANYYKVRRG